LAKSDIESTAGSAITHNSNNNIINAKNEAHITGSSKTIIKGGLTEVNGTINKLKLP